MKFLQSTGALPRLLCVRVSVPFLALVRVQEYKPMEEGDEVELDFDEDDFDEAEDDFDMDPNLDIDADDEEHDESSG